MRRAHLSPAIAVLIVGMMAPIGAARAHRDPPPQQAPSTPEEFTGVAANISNVGATGLVPVTVRIERWSGPEEQEKLFSALRNEGQEAFLKELTRVKPVGWIATPTSLRYDFFFVQQHATEKGRRIVMITDRPMKIAERMSASPSRDYPFTVVEMQIGPDGRGTGTLAQLVQLRLIGNFLGVENLATAPIQLNQLKKVK